MIGIYRITNKVNGKHYIGQAIDIEFRWEQHISALKNNKHYNDHLQRAWNKYDENNFEFKILQECDEEDLNIFETLYINILKTLSPDGYNLKEGGSSNKPSEETKQKISDTLKGKELSEEHKQKISEAFTGEKHLMYGKNHSEEAKQKMRKPKSEKTKQKMSEAQKGNKHPRWIEMIDDYKNGIRYKDFCFKYNVSQKIWNKLRKQIQAD